MLEIGYRGMVVPMFYGEKEKQRHRQQEAQDAKEDVAQYP
jgi:hypothetical protein